MISSKNWENDNTDLTQTLTENNTYQLIIWGHYTINNTTWQNYTRKLKANTISHQNRHKTLRHKLENILYQYFKRIMHHGQVGFILKIQAWLNILKSVNRVYHIIINS